MEPDTQQHSRKTKLTFLVRSLDYGGAQRQLVTLAKALDKSRFEVSVLTFYSGQPLEKELDGTGVRVISLDKRGRWDLLQFLRRLIREARLLRPDIVHGYLDIPNVLALFLRPFVHARVVWGVRASEIELRDYDWLFRLAAWLERFLARFPDLIVVNSVAAHDHLIAQGFAPDKLELIPNGIDTEMFKPDTDVRAKQHSEWNILDTSRLIGTVGRIDPVKDLPVFLRAAAIVCREINDVRFVCVGMGRARYIEQLRTLSDDLGLADRVIWVDAQLDVVSAYNALDLLVSSSRAESFPNAVAEAMSCGVPCVVTNVGDSALLVGDCGIVVPPQDPQALAAGIIRSLAANTTRKPWRHSYWVPGYSGRLARTEAGTKSRTRIIENFSVQQLAKRTAKALLSLSRT